MNHENFQIGINYLPVNAGPRLWREFDEGEIAEDMDRFCEWRLDPVRIFLSWEHVQPERERINLKVLHRLERLANLAADRSLHLWTTLFTGYLHRANWLPGWMVTSQAIQEEPPTLVEGFPVRGAAAMPWSDPRLLQAQKRMLHEVLAVLQSHPANGMFDLGDSISSVYQDHSGEQPRVWLEELIEAIRTQDEVTPVTLGLQMSDLLADSGFTPQLIGSYCDYIGLSTTRIPPPFEKLTRDPLLPLFLAELARLLAQKPVWISAIGLPTTTDTKQEQQPAWMRLEPEQTPMHEGDMESYAYQSLEILRRGGVPGALWWCYADYRPRVWRSAPFDRFVLERSYGLVRDDWQPKPTLQGMLAVERELGQTMDPDWLTIELEEFWQSPRRHLPDLYQQFRERIRMP